MWWKRCWAARLGLCPCGSLSLWRGLMGHGMEVVLGEEGICHHLMLVLWAGYICCRAFFGIHFLPVFVASLDPTLGLAQSHRVGVSPCPPMVPSPVRLSQGWSSWPGSWEDVPAWQEKHEICSSSLSEQLCEPRASLRQTEPDTQCRKQGALVAPVRGTNTSHTHSERNHWGNPGSPCAWVMGFLQRDGAVLPGALCKELGGGEGNQPCTSCLLFCAAIALWRAEAPYPACLLWLTIQPALIIKK